MKYQIVVVEKSDGTVAITRVISEAPVNSFSPDAAEKNGFTLSEDGLRWERSVTGAMIDEVTRKIDWKGKTVSWRRSQEADLPPESHRSFREAWVSDGAVVKVDMPKARLIHKDRLRAMRAPLLAALDVEYQRADEVNDAQKKAAIVVQKNALRDVTDDPRIEAATTPEELSAVIPEALAVVLR